MDMLAFLGSSSSEEDSNNRRTSKLETGKKSTKEPINPPTAIVCTKAIRIRKVRRKGCVDIVPSSKVRDSDIFSRSIPHRRGYWAGHVKIEVLAGPLSRIRSSPDDDGDSLEERKKNDVQIFRDFLERQGISGTIVEHSELHLSLSKQFYLQAGQIEPFVDQIRNLVHQERSTSLCVEHFSESRLRLIGELGSMNEILLLNESKTRSFLCWKVHPNVTLRRIVGHIDTVMKRYNQPVFYDSAMFHISIASFPGNVFEKLDADKKANNTNVHNIGPCENEGVGQSHTMPSNQNVDVHSTSNKTFEGCKCAHDEDDISSSTFDERFFIPFTELVCTIGTIRKFVLPLSDQ